MKPINNPKLPITKPGIYSGVPLSVYHSDGFTPGMSVSSSNLRTMWAKSPAHMYLHWAHNPNREEVEETKWMKFGRAAHHLYLGEDNFRTLFAMQPQLYANKDEVKPWNNNATYCRNWHQEQRESGHTVLTPADLAKITAIKDSLKMDPGVLAGWLNGDVEHSMAVLDAETGLWIKSRPDVIPNDGEYVDLKMTSDVTTVGVKASLRNFGYHMQGGLVWEVCEQLGKPFKSFMLLLAETDAPYCVRSVLLEREDLERGRAQCRAMMRWTAACIERGHWPGPGPEGVEDMSLPADERKRIDDRLTFLMEQADGIRP